MKGAENRIFLSYGYNNYEVFISGNWGEYSTCKCEKPVVRNGNEIVQSKNSCRVLLTIKQVLNSKCHRPCCRFKEENIMFTNPDE